MYEQYTDEQIVEMLVPKMNKCSNHTKWDGLIEKPWGNADLFKVIATIYRSAYIRGQLGRSFIIGEKKGKTDKTGCWVPANGKNVKEGDYVRYINEIEHENSPEYFPAKDAVGKVIKICNDQTYSVQWPKGSTSSDDKWYATWGNLEVLVDRLNEVKPTKAEKWASATKDNVKVGSRVRYLNFEKYGQGPEFYPTQDMTGVVVSVVDYDTCLVQWVSDEAARYADLFDLEVLLCE